MKYSDPFSEIQDQVGARVVVFYLSDVVRVSKFVERYLRPIETQEIVPESFRAFGYFGKHYVFHFPDEVLGIEGESERYPNFFELQIKTLFQHAWAEANHDLGYKPDGPLTAEEGRSIAYTAAQAWGADKIFEDLYSAAERNSKS